MTSGQIPFPRGVRCKEIFGWPPNRGRESKEQKKKMVAGEAS